VQTINHFKISNLRRLIIRTILERHSQDLRSTTPAAAFPESSQPASQFVRANFHSMQTTTS
ncbi:hypothetical protein, partial [Variovorax paradoxus]|uniref:hypothetical protein n=1 Tax=Variovorax paradoxus TaxID=34073 RepID=UPI001C0A83A8